MGDFLEIGPKKFRSRLLVGTAGYPDMHTMRQAVAATGAEIATVAMRRVAGASFTQMLDPNLFLLPNTAGCYTAREAILTAELAREALQTDWIKLEVIGDEKTLLPDSVELLKAAEALVNSGFVVLPYCTDDLILCRRLKDLGCAAIMPLAAPIGSGLGIRNPHNLSLLRETLSIPLIIDAGIGAPSDAAIAMELGADAVLVNTAIAKARHPVRMGKAFGLAIQAGRGAFLAGRIPKKFYAESSTPLEGRISCGLF